MRMGGSEHARAQSGRCSLRVTALEPLTRRSEMPKDLLTRLQRATSAEVMKRLWEALMHVNECMPW